MAKQLNEKTGTVDPELRRKMIERWENEGGKIGDIEYAFGPQSKSGKEPNTYSVNRDQVIMRTISSAVRLPS